MMRPQHNSVLLDFAEFYPTKLMAHFQVFTKIGVMQRSQVIIRPRFENINLGDPYAQRPTYIQPLGKVWSNLRSAVNQRTELLVPPIGSNMSANLL